MARGVVKFFLHEKGWGAISCPEIPDGFDAWIHFSQIEGDGQSFRSLDEGDLVDFEYEARQESSFRFCATWARKL